MQRESEEEQAEPQSEEPIAAGPGVSGLAAVEPTESTMYDEKQFTLDGEPIDLEEFLEVNEGELDALDLARIASLSPGSMLDLGGGAAPIFTLKREA